MSTWKYKRRVVAFVILIVAGGVALNLLAYRHAYAMMHFSKVAIRTDKPENLTVFQKLGVLVCGVSLPRPQASLSLTNLGPEGRAITVPCTNGVTLGTWHSPGRPSSALVILFHGYGGEKSGMRHEAEALLEIGLSVLLVDFRGSGDSSESYTTVGFDEAEDVAAVVRFARVNWPDRKVVLYGQSMGAAAILRAVHDCGVRPEALIVEAVFDKMLTTVRHRFEAMGMPSFPSAELLVFWGGRQAGFNGFSHNPVEYATSISCPTLFLHGSADPRAHIEEARRVFAAIPAPKRFREFPRLGHESSVVRFPKEWRETVGNFLKDVESQTFHRTGANLFFIKDQSNREP